MAFESDGPLIVDPVLPSIFSNRPCRTGLSHSVSGDTVSLTAALYQLMFSSICYALAVPELGRAYFVWFGTFCRRACGGKALTTGLVQVEGGTRRSAPTTYVTGTQNNREDRSLTNGGKAAVQAVVGIQPQLARRPRTSVVFRRLVECVRWPNGRRRSSKDVPAF